MRPSDQEKRGKLLNFVSQLFRDLSSATQSDQRTDRRLAMVARDLSGLPPKFRRIDSTAGAVLTDALAAGARRVSRLLPKLEIQGEAQAKHAFDLIGALQEFEDTTSMIAQGIPGSHGLRGKRAAALERQLGEFRRQSGDFGFQLRMSADLLRFSLGLPPLPNGFEYPRATGGCGCNQASPVKLQAKGKGGKPPIPPLKTPAAADIAEAASAIGEAGALISSYFDALGHTFALLAMAQLICDDLCTPVGITSCAFKGTNTDNDGTNWISQFEVTWTACCVCDCLFWTRNQSITFDTTHKVAGGAIPNTRPKAVADNRAKGSGTAEVKAYNATNFPPPPPVGGAAPAPPPFAPNPLIAPALNTIACPAKC